jgi:hypothetical protein
MEMRLRVSLLRPKIDDNEVPADSDQEVIRISGSQLHEEETGWVLLRFLDEI